MTINPPMSHQHWVRGGRFTIDCEMFMPGDLRDEFVLAYAYGKTKVGRKRLGFRKRNRANGLDDSRFPCGEWVRVLTGLPTSSGRYDTDMLFQWRLVDPPHPHLLARFVRVYSGGKRDGTGDAYFALPTIGDGDIEWPDTLLVTVEEVPDE